MMKDVKELVQKIQTKNNELLGLENQITVVGHEKLNQIIPFALNGLEFEEIYKKASRHDAESDQDGEYYVNDNGEVLRGVKVWGMIEDGDETDDVNWELHKEVFLLSDGKFKTFDTMYGSIICSDCEAMHTTIERVEAEKDFVSEYRNEAIINNILVELHQRALAVEIRKDRMSERLDNLNSLMVS